MIEERHGCAGTLRAVGVWGPFGAPITEDKRLA